MTSLPAPQRRRLAAAVAVGLGGAVLIPASAPAAERSASRDCAVIRGITERTVGFQSIGSPFPGVMQKVGDAVTFRDDIYDAQDTVIGHAIGYSTVVAVRPSDGHLITTYQESVEILGADGGTFRDTATVDRTAMIKGAWARFRATGTSGRFAGKTGIRQWRLVPPLFDPPQPTEHAEVEIALCAR